MFFPIFLGSEVRPRGSMGTSNTCGNDRDNDRGNEVWQRMSAMRCYRACVVNGCVKKSSTRGVEMNING